MAKRKKANKLEDVNVNEISFVDEPAVPDAKILLVKRLQKADVEIVETLASALEMLDSVRGMMPEEAGEHIDALKEMGRAMVAEMSEGDDVATEEQGETAGDGSEAAAPAPETESQSAEDVEMSKAGRVLSKANFEKIGQARSLLEEVIAAAGELPESAQQAEQEEEPAENGDTDESMDDVMSRAQKLFSDIRAKQQVAKKKADSDRLVEALKTLNGSLNGITKDVGELKERQRSLVGKVD